MKGRHAPGLALAAALSLAGACGTALADTPSLNPKQQDLQSAATALGDLGFAMLKAQGGANAGASGAGNAVVSPLALAQALSMLHAGSRGPAREEIEALFATGARKRHRAGARALRAMSAAVRTQGGSANVNPQAALKQAARVWVAKDVAKDLPRAYQRRMARKFGANAATLNFKQPEEARAQINAWTAQSTAGRVKELLPAGALASSTLLTLTTAVHFRSPWVQAFDPSNTEPRPFAAANGSKLNVASLVDDRLVAQAKVDGWQVYALGFKSVDSNASSPSATPQGPLPGAVQAGVSAAAASGSSGYQLLLMLPPTEGGTAPAITGQSLQRWRLALQPVKCAFVLPKFNLAPTSQAMKPALEQLGLKTMFSPRADLQPMLGRNAKTAHVDQVHQAAGMAIDENGGEAVAATSISIKPKSIAAAPPACAVDRPFYFALVQNSTGLPVFMGRVADPSQLQ